MPARAPGMKLNDRARRRPLVQALRRRRSLRVGLVPLLYVCAGIAAGLVVRRLDVGAQIHSSDAVALMAVVAAGLLALTGIVFALMFLVDAFEAVQLSAVLDEITTLSRAVIDGLYPAPFGGPVTAPPPVPDGVVQIRWPRSSRILRQIDLPGLIGMARNVDAVIRLRVMPGELIRENAVVFEIWDPSGTLNPETLLRRLEVGIDRNLTQDPLLGFRLLNDIALLSLSRLVGPTPSSLRGPTLGAARLGCVTKFVGSNELVENAGRVGGGLSFGVSQPQGVGAGLDDVCRRR